MDLLLEETFTEKDIASVGKKIAAILAPLDYFSVWLDADMGTGKTTLTGAILRGLGLSSSVPVQSPTFAIVLDYTIAQRTYLHMDLYRLELGFHWDDLVNLDLRPCQGLFIEWASRLPRGSSDGKATHILKLAFLNEDTRLLSFFRV